MAIIKAWPKLYKSGESREQQWQISVEQEVAAPDDPAYIVVRHGQVDGKIQESRVCVSKGKNLGRSNATTPKEQALLEGEAKFQKQFDKSYSETRGGGSKQFMPMLAHKYEDKKKKVVFDGNTFIQPKLDGIRCLAYRDGDVGIRLISRQGNEFNGLTHIRKALLEVMNHGDIWDGELFRHGMPFQEIISLVKKDRPESVNIQYHIYDKIGTEPFAHRIASLYYHDPLDEPLVLVPTVVCTDHENVDVYHQTFVSQGYEGAMLRWGTFPYKSGARSEHLLKVKAFQDEEFLIVDVNEGKGKFEGRAIFVCETKDGARFEAVPKGRDELRQKYFEDREKLVGMMLTVRFFEWTTSEQPVPRFPIAISPRDGL